MDVDFVTAVVAIAASVVAVVAGVERWLLPARRARQYELLTKIRNEEKASAVRRDALEAARTRTAAQLVGSFWVPATWILVWVAALVTVGVLLVSATAKGAPFLTWATAWSVSMLGLGWWRALHWFYLRQHLIGDYLHDEPTSAAHVKDGAAVYAYAVILTGASVWGGVALGHSIALGSGRPFQWVDLSAFMAFWTGGIVLWMILREANPPSALPQPFGGDGSAGGAEASQEGPVKESAAPTEAAEKDHRAA